MADRSGAGITYAVTVNPSVSIAVSQTALRSSQCGTVILAITLLGRSGNRNLQRLGYGNLQRVGIRTSVGFHTIHHHRIGSMVNNTVQIPSVGFTAGCISDFLRCSIIDLQRNISFFTSAGSSKHRLTAVYKGYRRLTRHIKGIGA